MKIKNLVSEMNKSLKSIDIQIINLKKGDLDNVDWNQYRKFKYEFIQYLTRFEIYIAYMVGVKEITIKNDSFDNIVNESIRLKIINTNFGNICLTEKSFIKEIFYGTNAPSIREIIDFYRINRKYFIANLNVMRRKIRIKIGE